jgi:hypothetical protein
MLIKEFKYGAPLIIFLVNVFEASKNHFYETGDKNRYCF